MDPKHYRVLSAVGHGDLPDRMPDSTTARSMDWSELKALKNDYIAAMNAIVGKAESEQREFSADEESTFKMLSQASKRVLNPEIERRAEASGAASGKKASSSSPSGWRDDQGRRIALLRHDQPMTARTASGFDHVPPAALGHVVRHLATGESSGFDQIGASSSLLGGSDGRGGYWIDPALATSIIDSARARSVALRAGVQTVEMTSPEMRMVRVEEDPTIDVVGEGNRITPSGIPFGALRLVAKKLACVISVSTELMEDASNLSAELDRLLGEAMAAVIDGAILAGTAKKGGIVGILGSAGIQEEAATGANKLLGWLNLLDSLQKLEDANLSEGACLILPPAMLRQLRGQSDGNGQFLAPPVDLAATPRWASTQLPATSGIHGRFAEVVLGVRSQLSIQVSPHIEFDKDKVMIRARWRGDVGLMRPAALVHLSGFDGSIT
jgi:HK97 family phage major capsid protein